MDEDGIRLLTPFGLQYTLATNRIPGAADYTELAIFTDQFLIDFFEATYSEDRQTTLQSFATIFVSGNFLFGSPIQVDYEAIARFDPNSPTIPDVQELDALLKMAFQGGNLDIYLSELSRLTSPAFSQTANVTVSNSTSVPLTATERSAGLSDVMRNRRSKDSPGRERAVLVGLISLSSGTLALALVAFIYCRRRRQNSHVRLGKAPPAASHAGETSADDSSNWTIDTESDTRPIHAVYISQSDSTDQSVDFSGQYGRPGELDQSLPRQPEEQPRHTSAPRVDDDDVHIPFDETGALYRNTETSPMHEIDL